MVDVIIPTYKPGTELWALLDILQRQTVEINRIILMNTEEEYYERLVCNEKKRPDPKKVEIHHLSKKEFDHGNTRNKGVAKSKADIFIMMTQDAMPADEFFVENLIRPLADEKIAACYGRQLADENSSLVEQVTREFNYPDVDCVKGMEDTERLGIKTYFCSNVCCAYKRQIFDDLGGFVHRTIFNEDMIYAAGVVKAGYKIAYASKAMVYHSHNYTASQQFHRNVDLGVSQADHPEVFEGISSESEGKKMVKTTIKRLVASKQALKVIPYIYMTGCKYIGYKIGKSYKKLPRWFVKKCSMSPEYFDKV